MKKPVLASVALHIAVILAILLDLPMWFSSPRPVPEEAVVIVDLSQVKIAEMTNLPKKREKKPKKEAPKKVEETKTPKTKAEPVKTAPEAKKEAVPDKPADARLEEKLKDKEKPLPPKAEKPKDDGMKSLLASVEKIKESLAKEEPPLETPEDKNKGIEGGREGSYMQDLTISEKDALASKLRSCWNLDAGIKGIADMVAEVQADLSPEGLVKEVKIADTYRYNNDPAFRSVAESARRAVLICGNMGEESPFVLLAKRHPDKYSLWKSMRLYFNPLDGGVK